MDDKSTKKREPGKGRTNNPKGRPVGAKNKVQMTVKKRIEEYLTENFDGFIEDIKRLDEKNRVKATLHLIGFIVPRPLADEEKNAIKKGNVFIDKLFGKGQAEDEE